MLIQSTLDSFDDDLFIGFLRITDIQSQTNRVVFDGDDAKIHGQKAHMGTEVTDTQRITAVFFQ